MRPHPNQAVPILALLGFLTFCEIAQAGLIIDVDKATQSLTVTSDGTKLYQWPVSTARSGYSTPAGSYRPQRLERSWFSKKYYDSPMPHSIFFHAGYAIHGSYELTKLGKPASHGCVRLELSNAAKLFALVSAAGAQQTKIIVHEGASRDDAVVAIKPAPGGAAKQDDLKMGKETKTRVFRVNPAGDFAPAE